MPVTSFLRSFRFPLRKAQIVHYPGKGFGCPQSWLFKMTALIPLQCASHSFFMHPCICLSYTITHLRHDRAFGLFLFISKTQIDTVTLYLLLFHVFQKSRKPDRRGGRCNTVKLICLACRPQSKSLNTVYLCLSWYASLYLMPGYCFKVIFDNSKINLRIKSSKIFCCNISIFQFKKKLLLIYGSRCQTYCLHTSFKPFCTPVCLSKFLYTLTFMWNSLCFTISQRNNDQQFLSSFISAFDFPCVIATQQVLRPNS